MFEVNTSNGELLKFGARVRLPAQPFAILLVLLKTPGELVTRERLREQIWAPGTFVDFEHGLNAAINKLRRALSDSAENARYIETISLSAYRDGRPERQLGQKSERVYSRRLTEGTRHQSLNTHVLPGVALKPAEPDRL